jgi:hypothetical protein
MTGVAKVGLGAMLVLLVIAGYARPQVAPSKSLAAQCAPDLDKVRERIFASPDGKSWNEYVTTKQVPRSNGGNGGLIYGVKTSSTGRQFVRTTEYGEGSARYGASCYDRAGKLRSFHYEIRTGSGWGYEDIRTYNAAGKPLRKSARYLDTKNNQTIPRPSAAGKISDFTQPGIYGTFDSLPIAGALKQKNNATAQ